MRACSCRSTLAAGTAGAAPGAACLQVREQLAAHDALHEHVQVRVVLEAGHQVDHEGAVALGHDLLLALHMLLRARALR